MFNKVILIGNLTRDIEIKNTPSGLSIANTWIAVNRKFKSQTGENKEEVLFLDIAFFGRTAEIVQMYLTKGSKILVEGHLKLDQWTDTSGNKRSKHSLVIESMKMLGDDKDDGSETTPLLETNQNNKPEISFDEEDLPF